MPPTQTIKFRCPHRSKNWPNGVPKAERIALRMQVFIAPPETVWEPIQEEVRKGGRIVNEVVRHRALLVCPECGDTVAVTTDQLLKGNT